MKEEEMKKIGKLITEVINEVKKHQLPGKDERNEYISRFKKDIKKNATLKRIRNEVKELTKGFEIY